MIWTLSSIHVDALLFPDDQLEVAYNEEVNLLYNQKINRRTVEVEIKKVLYFEKRKAVQNLILIFSDPKLECRQTENL